LSIRNSTGAGDALFAGLVYGSLKGLNVRESVLTGMAAAILTLTQKRGTNQSLNMDKIKKTIIRYQLGR
jgi:fructose-1-phosphate kinase PfkB-like protein